MPNPPSAPDFRGLATDQGNENLRAAREQARLNNPNFRNWMGGQTITYGPDGQPTINQELNPQIQGLFNQHLGIQGQAGQMASGMFGNMRGIDFNGLSPQGQALDPNSLPSMPGNYGDVRNQVIEAMMGRSNREINQRGDQMNSDLIARGLSPGTEAYTREQDALGRQRNDALQQAQIAGGNAANQAIQADLARRGMGGAEQAQRFGQQFSNRGQGFGEQMGNQQLTGQQLQMLLGASNPQMPNFGQYNGNTQVAPAPLFGAGQAQSNYDVDTWNAMMQQQNSRNNGLFSLGDSFMNSDAGQGLLSWGGNQLLDWWRNRSPAPLGPLGLDISEWTP